MLQFQSRHALLDARAFDPQFYPIERLSFLVEAAAKF
jgi:hypothetical protein